MKLLRNTNNSETVSIYQEAANLFLKKSIKDYLYRSLKLIEENKVAKFLNVRN